MLDGAGLCCSCDCEFRLICAQVGDGRHGKTLREIGQLPARGFVNALKLARSGRFVLAGMGQEPRLGRWARDSKASNGVLLHRLEFANDEEQDEGNVHEE